MNSHVVAVVVVVAVGFDDVDLSACLTRTLVGFGGVEPERRPGDSPLEGHSRLEVAIALCESVADLVHRLDVARVPRRIHLLHRDREHSGRVDGECHRSSARG